MSGTAKSWDWRCGYCGEAQQHKDSCQRNAPENVKIQELLGTRQLWLAATVNQPHHSQEKP